IVNDSMKPRQRYGIESTLEELKVNDGKRVNLEVWDRVDLILGIFDKHARTAEAKLQLELARIKHLGPRIFGMGKDMSNQGGGIGTRGLGETNTEIMKRHLAEHTHRVEEKISKLLRSREHKRERRDKLGFRSAALVGYTNAGKSELFRSLTRKQVLVRDALFATLDTTLGKISPVLCPEPYLVSDTIGFIENLPMDLVAAFKSTLEEALAADLLLHVVDISDPDHKDKIRVVEELLSDIGMNGIPRIRVYNKVDRLSGDPAETILDKLRSDLKEGVFISAKEKVGLDGLGSAIHQALGGMRIPAENGVGALPRKLELLE
ncbi:MAG: GTPase HflX, partial [Spirochaetia bacterium]|nr:GTPase HflX [Spirochaetia bacterium]